jgi:hypothetical protein
VFDVGAEPFADDGLDDDVAAVLDEAVADVRDVDFVGEVAPVKLVDDCDRDVVAVEDPEGV